MKLRHLVVILLGFYSSFSSYALVSSFQSRIRSRQLMTAHVSDAASSSGMGPAEVVVDERELIKLFSRLADDYLLLDIPDAGTPGMMNCCHGGCDNCAYSHIFDNLSAGRPKWVPLYASRQLIDGRTHTSPGGACFRTIPIARSHSKTCM